MDLRPLRIGGPVHTADGLPKGRGQERVVAQDSHGFLGQEEGRPVLSFLSEARQLRNPLVACGALARAADAKPRGARDGGHKKKGRRDCETGIAEQGS